MTELDKHLKHILKLNDPARAIAQGRIEEVKKRIMLSMVIEPQNTSKPFVLSLLRRRAYHWLSFMNGRQPAFMWRSVACSASVIFMLGLMIGSQVNIISASTSDKHLSGQDIYYQSVTSSWGGWFKKGD